MPEKSQKRKLRSDQSSSLDNGETASQVSDENTCLTEQDFSDNSNKIENRLSKRLRDAEFGQREILRLIENLASKGDGLSNPATESSGSIPHHDTESEPIGNPEPSNNFRNVSSNMVTGVSANQHENHQRSSSLPPPNQRYPDDIIDKLLQSLQTATTHNSGVPRLPKAMSTTMPSFDGKTDKFEHFEDLLQTSLKVYPNITEEEKIHYFHSLLRGEAFQTFRNMTEATHEHLNDILAGFRRRYVRQQSVATARCKWENLSFNPSHQTFPDFLEQYEKLAQEAYGEDAPRFIETSFYAKMPRHLKKVLIQARLEIESYQTMVQHLEREIELNGLATNDSPSITGVHNIEPSSQQQQNNPPRTTGPCFGCGNPGHLLRNCRKTNRDKRSQKTNAPTQSTPCETCGKMSHETKDCFSGANWANRSSWWKTPKTTPPITFPLHNNHKQSQCSSHKPWHHLIWSQKTPKATSSLRGLHRLSILHNIRTPEGPRFRDVCRVFR